MEQNILLTEGLDCYNTLGTNNYFDDTCIPKKWGYCDQLKDWETGNYYMRARYYNTDTGRFISEDPIKDGSNWYAYCVGNPVMFVDPFGLANFVAIRDWYDDNKAYCEENYGNAVGILEWDVQNKTTSMLLMSNGYGGYAEFKVGVDGTYIDSDTKRMYVDEQLLWSTFGQAIDPPIQVNEFRDTVVVASFLVLMVKAPAIIASTKKLINTYTTSAFIAAENGLSKSLEQGVNFSKTATEHMIDPNRFVPVQTLIGAIKI